MAVPYQAQAVGHEWAQMDPGGGGAIVGLAVAPASNRVWAAMDCGGFRHSADDGQSWVNLNQGVLFEDGRGSAKNMQANGSTPLLIGASTAGSIYRFDFAAGDDTWKKVFDSKDALPSPDNDAPLATSCPPGRRSRSRARPASLSLSYRRTATSGLSPGAAGSNEVMVARSSSFTFGNAWCEAKATTWNARPPSTSRP